jgi:hypothetical protein
MTTAKKPATKTAAEKSDAPFGYLQNTEGRVFIATAPLIKQMKKGKFGLIKITKSVYDEALANGGLADAIPDVDESDVEI